MGARLRLSALPIAVMTVVALWSSSREAATQSSAPQYGVTLLGTRGASPRAVALGISPDAAFPTVVGYSPNSNGDDHAFSGNPFRLIDLGTLGGHRSEARATTISRAVGRSQIASGAYHAFLAIDWQQGSITDLGTLGGSESYANAVAFRSANGTFVVVGASQTTGNQATRAFLWDTASRVMDEMPATLGGANTVATGVNELTHAVGYADLPGGSTHHAFLWANGITQDLGSLGTTSEALAVNDSDIVVGRSQLGNGAGQHAFRSQNGVMQDLGTLGGANSEATHVNWSGAIVGWAETAQGVRHAFIWRNGVMRDLNALIPSDAASQWVLTAATGIAGGAAGREAIAGYGQFQGETRAFLLTPPLDLSLSLRLHRNMLDTNIPNPHEAGQVIPMGVTVNNNEAFTASNVTVTDTYSGPVHIENWSGADSCTQSGLQLTCTFNVVDGAANSRDLIVNVRATGAGEITHSASIVSADQPDPSPGNNSGSESNTAVSLATLEPTKTTAVGGESVLTRATLTSPAPFGGATVTLTSSRPDIASVPSQFDVLRGCCDNGMWREFYVTTRAVSAPVTVDIGASYGLVTRVFQLTIMPSATPSPFGGRYWRIPGTIEAENFDEGGEGVAYHDSSAGNKGGAYRSTDVDIEATTDTSGDYNVGWMIPGEWLNYTVSVDQSGSYTLKARVAANGAGGTFHVEFGGVNKTGPITIPNTGGWQAWVDIAATVSLSAGVQSMRIVEDAYGANGVFGNINYLLIIAPQPFGGIPRAVPGTIQAEDFDVGGEGMGYHDTTAENTGGEYRPTTGVDIQTTTDAGGGYNVGWMTAGEWLNYTVSVAQSGTYKLTVRVAAKSAGGTFHVEFGGVDKTGPLTIPNTGAWQAWTDVSASVTLGAGVQSMRIVEEANGPGGVFGNINYLQLITQSTPFGGAPRAVPGTIQAEDFDDGGEGLAYHDTTAENTGGEYRTTGVDIQTTTDAGGGYNVGWMTAGEWLNYTVSVAQSGAYILSARVAAKSAGGTFHVEFGGVDKTGPLTIPNTGAWQTWTDVSASVSLSAGLQSMRIVADANGPAAVFGNINYVRLSVGDTVTLTGGFLNFHLGDPGAGRLTGDGFAVDGTASGGWPAVIRPGDSVDFSTAVGLSNWGNATVNGTQLHGDPSGPGAGRLWISGSLRAVAKPFTAPPPSGSTASFSAPVTLSGTVSGYYNSDTSQPPLFTVNVVGQGIAGGTYRFIDNGGGDMFYLNNCCASITITAMP